MKNLKEILLKTGYFVDNEYLDKYLKLISDNETTIKSDQTNIHHIIPLKYYEYKYACKSRIESEKKSKELGQLYRINLEIKYHILAHVYLALCSSEDYFSYINICSVNKRLKSNLNKDSILLIALNPDELDKYNLLEHRLSGEFNVMNKPDVKNHHDEKMRSEEVRSKISKTVHEKIIRGEFFTEEHKRKISESQKNTIYIHRDNITTRIHKEDLQKYLNEGWLVGNGHTLSESHVEALRKSHLGKKYSPELKKKLSEAHKGQVPVNKGIPCSEKQKAQIKERLKGSKLMNKNGICVWVHKEDIDKYLAEGYSIGRLPYKKK